MVSLWLPIFTITLSVAKYSNPELIMSYTIILEVANHPASLHISLQCSNLNYFQPHYLWNVESAVIIYRCACGSCSRGRFLSINDYYSMIFCILHRRLMNFVVSSMCPMKTIMDMVEGRTNIRNGHADRLRKFMPSEKFTHRIRTGKVCDNKI